MDYFHPNASAMAEGEMDYFSDLAPAMARVSVNPLGYQDPKVIVPHWKPEHRCKNCLESRPEGPALYKFLHRLPPELQLLIIKYAVVEYPCIKDIFGNCFDPWSCKEGSHTQTEIFPSLCITTICSHVSEGAWQIYYRESPVVFNRTSFDYGVALSETGRGDVDDTYDPRAMLMLHYYPWRNNRRRIPLHTHPNYEGYLLAYAHRHTIRHLVLKTYSANWSGHVMDWNWILNIDWDSLPQLETLYLDFKGMALQPVYRFFNVDTPMVEGAIHRMSVLRLKKLVIVGLSSRGRFRGRPCFPVLRKAFRGVMADGGVVEFIDSGKDVLEW